MRNIFRGLMRKRVANLSSNIIILYKLSKDILNNLFTAGPKQCVPKMAIPSSFDRFSKPDRMAACESFIIIMEWPELK